MNNAPTDRQLSKALRQAALRIESQTREIESLTLNVSPSPDKLSVLDFIGLIRKASTNGQIKAIVDMVDVLHIEDSALMEGNDWVILTTVISKRKALNDSTSNQLDQTETVEK